MTACPVCGSERTRVYLAGARHALTPGAFGQSRTEVSTGEILQCRDCGLGYTAVRPTPAQLAALYRAMDTGVYEAETTGRDRTARSCYRILAAQRPTPGRLLEAGCASGRFLACAQGAGWSVTGVEPSPALSEQARRRLGPSAHIIESTLEAAPLDAASFDAVALWDVLEHVTNPTGLLTRVCELLVPGGVVVLNVPNIASTPARLLGRRWPLLLPEHLSYFTRESLTRAAARAGLTPRWFGQRRAAFSIGYIFHRLAQHGLPGSAALAARVRASALAGAVIPVSMGELSAALVRGDGTG